ncbi:MAG: radical SAM protein [Patescibacteria group bacterium]
MMAKKTKVLLIVPPNSLEERYGKLKFVGALYPSLGLAAIGAITEKAGFPVKVIDCEAEGLSYSDLEQKIKEYQPEVIGMQTFCNTINRAFEIAKRTKKSISRDIKIVLGGVQATLFPEKYAENQYVDFIVKGEGEIIFNNLLDALENNSADFSHVPGLVWKKEGQIISNQNEKLITNLDDLPYPARHLFDSSKYYPSAQLRGKRIVHIITSRGCPFNCGFCSCHKTFGRSYRFMSTDRVINEIKYLKEKYRIDGLNFYDDTFTVNRPRIMELCDRLIKEKIKLPWICFTRVDCVDPELLKKMKEAGCYQVFYGVECATQRLLDIISKGFTLERIRQAFKWTKEAGLEVLASFIIGLPTETVEEAKKTLDFAIELGCDFAHWEVYTPHPGTNLFEIALQHGNLLTTDWNKFSPWSDEPVYLPFGRTIEELKSTKEWAYRKFYLRPFFILKRLYGIFKLPPDRIIRLVKSGLTMITK